MKSFLSVTAPSEQTVTGCRAADCSLKKEGGTKSVSHAEGERQGTDDSYQESKSDDSCGFV